MKKGFLQLLLFAAIALLLFIPFPQILLYIVFGFEWMFASILLITKIRNKKTNERLPRIILLLVMLNMALSISFTRSILTSKGSLSFDSKLWENVCLILPYSIIIAVLYFGSLFCRKVEKLTTKAAENSFSLSATESEYLNGLSGSMKFLFGNAKSLFFLCVICIIGSAAIAFTQHNLGILYSSSIKTMILIILSIFPLILMSITVKSSLQKDLFTKTKL